MIYLLLICVQNWGNGCWTKCRKTNKGNNPISWKIKKIKNTKKMNKKRVHYYRFIDVFKIISLAMLPFNFFLIFWFCNFLHSSSVESSFFLLFFFILVFFFSASMRDFWWYQNDNYNYEYYNYELLL